MWLAVVSVSSLSLPLSLTQQQELAVVSIELQQLRAEVVDVRSQSVFSQKYRKLLQLHRSQLVTQLHTHKRADSEGR